MVSAKRPLPRLAALLLPFTAACGLHQSQDSRDYLDALRGEESGLSRQQQIALLDRAIRANPNRPEYWETRAIYKIDLREFPHAIAGIGQALRLAPRPYLHYLRGLVLCQSGRIPESLPDFDAAIAKQPENAQFYRGRALARAAAGQPQAALDDAAHLLRLAPQMAESHYARAIALQSLGRHAEAIAGFNQALRIRPELVYPLQALATSLEQSGDPAAAAATRTLAQQRVAQYSSCAPCLDPFRY